MNNLEKLLEEERKKYDNLEMPDDMESRLKLTLENRHIKKRKNIKIKVASLILAVLLISYNIDTLAYYGKKFIGYESIMNGTLKELNELGKGQVIDKSYTFNNGVKITVDGIILDDNSMTMFYTIYSPDGNVKDVYSNLGIVGISGFLDRGINYGGQGEINEEETEMKWIISTHEPPKFFERTIKMKLNYIYEDGEVEYGEIDFKIDRNEALQKQLKINIDESIEIGNRSIKVKSLRATPTSTVIKGEIQNPLELSIDIITKDRYIIENIDMKLIVDGKEIDKLGSGISTDYKGVSFDFRFDSLPTNTKDLKMELVSFVGDFKVEESFNITKGEKQELKVLEENIKIDNVYEEEGNTYITIITDDNTLLSEVYLDVDGKKVELEKIIPSDYEKIVEGNNGRINYTRTLEFKGVGENLKLGIDRIRYKKFYNEIIYEYNIYSR